MSETLRSRTYIVQGTPVAWQRARVSSTNKRRFYDGQINEKDLFRLHVNKQHPESWQFSGPLSIDAIFYFKGGAKNEAKNRGRLYTSRPDIDNLVKFILDTCTKVLYYDDNQFCIINAQKRYGLPRTEFTIREIGVNG